VVIRRLGGEISTRIGRFDDDFIMSAAWPKGCDRKRVYYYRWMRAVAGGGPRLAAKTSGVGGATTLSSVRTRYTPRRPRHATITSWRQFSPVSLRVQTCWIVMYTGPGHVLVAIAIALVVGSAVSPSRGELIVGKSFIYILCNYYYYYYYLYKYCVIIKQIFILRYRSFYCRRFITYCVTLQFIRTTGKFQWLFSTFKIIFRFWLLQ